MSRILKLFAHILVNVDASPGLWHQRSSRFIHAANNSFWTACDQTLYATSHNQQHPSSTSLYTCMCRAGRHTLLSVYLCISVRNVDVGEACGHVSHCHRRLPRRRSRLFGDGFPDNILPKLFCLLYPWVITSAPDFKVYNFQQLGYTTQSATPIFHQPGTHWCPRLVLGYSRRSFVLMTAHIRTASSLVTRQTSTVLITWPLMALFIIALVV